MRLYLEKVLRYQAVRYLKNQSPKVVVVSGSVGKTSTTQAIATVLEEGFRVRKTLKNYNTNIGVPCSVFGRQIPQRLHNVFAWGWLIAKNELSIRSTSKVEVLVLELGTDAPGDIGKFDWLKPDIAVVTAVAYEHMAYFKDLYAVAEEELSVAAYSDKTFINKRMIDSKFLHLAKTDQLFNYDRTDIEKYSIRANDLQVVGEHSIDAIVAALAVGKELGLSSRQLSDGAKRVVPQKGRMRRFAGKKQSIIIDDTYNSSPEAAQAALNFLVSTPASKRIALLGTMNELGGVSRVAHTQLGDSCNPKKLSLVVTLGGDANAFTAQAAEDKGCRVVRTHSPYEAARIIEKELEKDCVVLCKGSQNGVFAEEAVKLLLANKADEKELVRQDTFWMRKKEQSFKGV